MSFNHTAAQSYELDYTISWIKENYTQFINEIDDNRALNIVKPYYVKEFFAGKVTLFNEFYNYIKHRNCVEIANGALGFLGLLNHVLHGKKYIIDPLVGAVNQHLLSTYGRTWFDKDLVLYSQPAEQFIESLVGQIDGVVFARNSWIHFEDCKLALQNVAKYAASGCYFLTWSETKLFEPDIGHRQCIFETPQDMEDYILGLGFELIRRTPQIGDPAKSEEYGGVFRKL